MQKNMFSHDAANIILVSSLFGQWTIYRSIYGLFLGFKVTKAKRLFERLPIQYKAIVFIFFVLQIFFSTS